MAADRNGAITGYFVNVTNVENDITLQLFTTSTTLIVDSLEPFTVYTVIVAAQTAVDAGPYSIGLSQITMEAGKTIIICFRVVSFLNSIYEEGNSVLYKLIQSSICINKSKEHFSLHNFVMIFLWQLQADLLLV